MKKLVPIYALTCASIFIIGCPPEPDWILTADYQLSPVVSVFMNQVDEYTIYTKEGNELKAKRVQGGIRIVTDVPKEEPMYADIKVWEDKRNAVGYKKVRVVIHIHSPKDISAGGWEKRHYEGMAQLKIEKGQNHKITEEKDKQQ